MKSWQQMLITKRLSYATSFHLETSNLFLNFKMLWTQDKVLELIAAYKLKPVLWDPKQHDYPSKLDAWDELAEEINVDRTEVEKKMKCLIGQFQRDLKKVSKITEDGTFIDVNKSRWFAFKELLFLRPYRTKLQSIREAEIDLLENNNEFATKTKLKTRQSNQEAATTENEKPNKKSFALIKKRRKQSPPEKPVETKTEILELGEIPIETLSVSPNANVLYVSEVLSLAPNTNLKETVERLENGEIHNKTPPPLNSTASSSKHKKYRKRSRSHRKIEARVSERRHSSSSGDSDIEDYTIFGEYVARKIRKLGTKFARSTAQHRINNILYEAEMGKFDFPEEFQNGPGPVEIFLPSGPYSEDPDADST